MSKFIKTAQQNAEISKKNASLIKKWGKTGIPQSAMLTPIVDKDNWAIINNSIIGLPFQIPYSCSNSINSHCQPYTNVSTVEECKNICKNDPLCQIGNFITMDNKTYCLPYAHTSNITKNMSDSIWNLYSNYQSKYIKSSSFLNYDLYSPWNNINYSLFFGDALNIAVFNSNESDDATLYIGNDDTASVSKIQTLLQIVAPGSLTDNSGEVQIKNYYNVMINIYGTYLILQQQLIRRDSGDASSDNYRCSGDESSCSDKYQYTDNVEWFDSLGSLQNTQNQITLICLEKQPHESIDYDDTFVFTIGDKYICIDDKNSIVLKSADFLRANKNYQYRYKFIPKFTVSYCNNDVELDLKKLAKNDSPDNNSWAKKFRCKVTTIDKCIRENNDFFYIGNDNKKHIVYRGEWCYGICRDDGSVRYTNRIPLFTDNVSRSILIDQLIISISIVLISYFLFMLLK